jgi:putative ABC transport system substrate-binding protein
MLRRAFIPLLGATAVSPLALRAQETGRVYRLGFLVPIPREVPPFSAFFDELKRAGFVEGRNLAIIPGGFHVRAEQAAERAAAVVRAAPDAIVCGPDEQIRALQAVTKTIPLIGMTEDMVAAGFVASLSRPGGNTTGISLLSPELDGKRQEILIEAAPAARRIATMAEARSTPERHIEMLAGLARARGVESLVYRVTRPAEIIAAIDAAKAAGAGGANFLATPLFFNQSAEVIARIGAARLPAIYQWPEMVELGGLMAYGPRFDEVFRQRARLTIKVLRGARPAELPIEQPTSFALVISLRAARAIGHDIPALLLNRADKVIE